jgi:hypothetical protein
MIPCQSYFLPAGFVGAGVGFAAGFTGCGAGLTGAGATFFSGMLMSPLFRFF